MSRHVYWPNRPHRERSPFELGDLSPVRVTEYYPLRSHTASTDQAEEPIRCLRELGQRGLVDVVGSHADGPSRLEISERVTESEASGYRALTVHEPTAGRSTGIVRLEIWRHTEATLQARLRDVAADHLSSVLTIAAAHEALGNDLLSTTDGVLLQLRDEPTLLRLNVCTPAEACRIVGLLLRTREDYPINHYFSVDREGFYWPLMRHRLPAMWPYFSACVLSDPQRRDGILYLGQTVLSRAKWALEARDEIGAQYYRAQTNSTADRMNYHTAYLVTLLMGALDAAARVAARTYGAFITTSRVSFRNPAFRTALRNAGAAELADFVSSIPFLSATQILNTARNAIHGAAYTPLSFVHQNEPRQSLVRVSEQDSPKIAAALGDAGGMECWGFTRAVGLCFEPFVFANEACRRALELLNEIVRLTDVRRLFPPGVTVPELPSGPPVGAGFEPAFLARLDTLG